MQVVFCRNQVQTAEGNSATTIYSEAIRLGSANRVTINAVVPYMYGGGGPAGRLWAVSVEVSNDGDNWTVAGIGVAAMSDAGTSAPVSVSTPGAALCRLAYAFTLTAAGAGAVCYTVAGTIEKV